MYKPQKPKFSTLKTRNNLSENFRAFNLIQLDFNLVLHVK